jgi:hypothetical protein
MGVVPAFDVLRGALAPTDAFGIVLKGADAARALAYLRDVAQQARHNLREVFGIDVSLDSKGVEQLDSIVGQMWATGWDPEKDNLNLFATHFGALLYEAMLGPSMAAIVRSLDYADHHSLWQAATQTEFFPFHKAAKCLVNGATDSMMQMYRTAIDSTIHQE